MFHEDSTASFDIDDDKQVWKCFGCDAGGDLIEYVKLRQGVDFLGAIKHLGAEVSANGSKPKAPPKTTPQYVAMSEFEKARYKLPGDWFFKCGCRENVVGGNLYMNIPTRDEIPRMRLLRGSGAKYKPDSTCEAFRKLKAEDKQVQSQFFMLEEAIQRAKDEKLGKVLVLCNGQTSTMVGHYYGVPVFCQTDGEKRIQPHLLPELIKLLADGWQLYVALDCDNHGKGHKVASEIITQLHQYKPHFVSLGGKDGYDVADHCVKYGDKSWSMMVNMVTGVPVSLPDIALADIQKSLKDLKIKDEKKGIDINQVIGDLEARIELLKQQHVLPTPRIEVVNDAYNDYLEARKRDGWITGLTTGLPKLDNALGGLEESALYTWLSHTGMMKTQLLIGIAAHLLGQAPGAVIVGEANAKQITNRLVAYGAGVPYKSLRTGKIRIREDGKPDRFVRHTQEQHNQICELYGKLRQMENKHKLKFRDSDEPLTTIWLRRQVRRWVEDYGIKWLIAESVDNIPTPGVTGHTEKITHAAEALEAVARDFNITVLTTSQIGRKTVGRENKEAQLTDGHGSSYIEFKSHAVMSAYCHDVLVKRGEAQPNPDKYPPGTGRITLRKLRDDDIGAWNNYAWRGGIGWFNLAR
jgi:replicative DNA helicase